MCPQPQYPNMSFSVFCFYYQLQIQKGPFQCPVYYLHCYILVCTEITKVHIFQKFFKNCLLWPFILKLLECVLFCYNMRKNFVGITKQHMHYYCICILHQQTLKPIQSFKWKSFYALIKNTFRAYLFCNHSWEHQLLHLNNSNVVHIGSYGTQVRLLCKAHKGCLKIRQQKMCRLYSGVLIYFFKSKKIRFFLNLN